MFRLFLFCIDQLASSPRVLTASTFSSNFSWQFKQSAVTRLAIFVSATVHSKLLRFVDLHSGMILVNNQLDAQFFMYVYFYSLHISSSHVPIFRRIIVSIRHLVYVTLEFIFLILTAVMPPSLPLTFRCLGKFQLPFTRWWKIDLLTL